MNIQKHLKEALNSIISVRLDDSEGLASLTAEQITSLVKAEVKLELLLEHFKEQDELLEVFSNCCGVGMDRDRSHCPACHEGCAVVNENDEEVE